MNRTCKVLFGPAVAFTAVEALLVPVASLNGART